MAQELRSSIQTMREEIAAKDAERKCLDAQINTLANSNTQLQSAIHAAQMAEAVAKSQKEALSDACEAQDTELALRKDQLATMQALEAEKKNLEEQLRLAKQEQATRPTPSTNDAGTAAAKDAELNRVKAQLAAAQAEIAKYPQKMQYAVIWLL